MMQGYGSFFIIKNLCANTFFPICNVSRALPSVCTVVLFTQVSEILLECIFSNPKLLTNLLSISEYVHPESKRIWNVDFFPSPDNVSTPDVDLILGFKQVGVILLSPTGLNHRYPGYDFERPHHHTAH
jgi:hypothetical protein